MLTHRSFLLSPETILHPGAATRPTPSPKNTPRATPSTAHVKVTMPRQGHASTSRFGERAEDQRERNALPPSSWVEGLPPLGITEKPGDPSITTHRYTTHHHKPPRATPPSSTPAPRRRVSPPSPYEDSGSGEPSGDDDEEGSAVTEASGAEPVGKSTSSLHFPECRRCCCLCKRGQPGLMSCRRVSKYVVDLNTFFFFFAVVFTGITVITLSALSFHSCDYSMLEICI